MNLKLGLILVMLLLSLGSANALVSTIFSDNFNDGTYSPEWVVGSSTWSAASNALGPTGSPAVIIATFPTQDILSQAAGSFLRLDYNVFNVDTAPGNDKAIVHLIGDGTSYMAFINDDSALRFSKCTINADSNSSIICSPGFADINATAGTVNGDATLSLIIYQNGDVGLDLNGVRKHTLSGSTWTDFNRIKLGTEGTGQTFDNFLLTLFTPETLTANFTYTPTTPTPLDPENGISDSNIDFNDASVYGGGLFWKASTWYVNGNIVSYDQNFRYSFTYPGDYNVYVKVQDTADNNADVNKTITIKQYPQDINFFWTPSLPSKGTNVDFNSSTDEDANITNWYWQIYDFNYSPDTDQNITTQFTTTGTSVLVCLTVQDNEDLNKTKCANLAVAGGAWFKFYDENSGISFPPNILTWNGVDITGDLNDSNIVVIPFSTYSDTNTEITLTAGHTDYTTRSMTFEVSRYSDIAELIGLLPTELGQSVEFQFYDTNLLVLGNAFIGAYADNNVLVGRNKTDNIGKTTFFLDARQDINYSFWIDSADEQQFRYNMVLFILKVPKDEKDLNTIIPFNVSVSGLVSQDFNDQNVDVNLYILSETLDFYSTIFVDRNENYLPRAYLTNTKGGPSSYTLQSYLVHKDDGASVAFFTFNKYTRETIEDVQYVLRKSILGEGTVVVESRQTDSSGATTLAMIAGDTYILDIYIDQNLITSFTIIPEFTQYTVNLILTSYGDLNVNVDGIKIVFDPAASLVWPGSDNNIFVCFTIEQPNTSTYSITYFDINVYQKQVNLFTKHDTGDWTGPTTSGYVKSFEDCFKVPATNVVENFPLELLVRTKMTNTSEVSFTFDSAHVFGYVSDANLNVVAQGKEFSQELGLLGRAFVMFILTIFILIASATVFPGGRTHVIVSMVVMGMFTFLGILFEVVWLPLEIYIMIVVLGLMYAAR